MKITTRQMPYKEVMALPRPKHRNPMKPSRLLGTVVRLVSLPTMLKTKFSYTTERMELVGNQPCLILMNHSSFTDMQDRKGQKHDQNSRSAGRGIDGKPNEKEDRKHGAKVMRDSARPSGERFPSSENSSGRDAKTAWEKEQKGLQIDPTGCGLTSGKSEVQKDHKQGEQGVVNTASPDPGEKGTKRFHRCLREDCIIKVYNII